MARVLTYGDAILEGTREAMALDSRVICYGLGVPDPKGIFGTTLGLQKQFGKQRVFDMPTSENGMTGVAVGAALGGLRPILISQRVDFFLLAMDQLVNNAAKWHYMFGGKTSVPMVTRLIVGRGWGQGPTHSQSLHAWFAHIPGLKVVMPTTPADAKGLLMSAVFDGNPVVYIEHRWLHNTRGEVPEGDYRTPLGKAALLRRGDDVTLVAMSNMTVEAMRASDFMAKNGVHCDVVDLRTIAPLDWDTVLGSVRRTGRLLAIDAGAATGSVAGEVIARVVMTTGIHLRCHPRRIAMPDVPVPTSHALTRGFYPGAAEIARNAAEMTGRAINVQPLHVEDSERHDIPGNWFKGPF